MKLFRGKYGWSTLTKSNQEGTINKLYMNVQFPKFEEPLGDELDGELFFRTDNGEEKKCFITNYQKQDGTLSFKLVFNKEQTEPNETNMMQDNSERYQTKLSDGESDMFGAKTNDIVDDEDLPFY